MLYFYQMRGKPDRNVSMMFPFCAFGGHPKKLFLGVVREGGMIIQNAFKIFGVKFRF